MILKHKIAFVEGDIDTERVQLISVHNPKYGRIDLCFKANMHIPFAKIKLHSTDTYGDAKKVENDAARLGNEIAKRWNEHGEMVEVLIDSKNLLDRITESPDEIEDWKYSVFNMTNTLETLIEKLKK